MAGIEPRAAPGSPAHGESAGDLVMVVAETTNTFREYARTNGTWAPTAFAPYTLSDLTDTASASQFGGPSLTADGLVLVFSITTGTDVGIYYVARPSLRVPFDARTGPHSRLLAPPPASVYFSPQLSASCTQVTVVTDQQAVVRYGQCTPWPPDARAGSDCGTGRPECTWAACERARLEPARNADRPGHGSSCGLSGCTPGDCARVCSRSSRHCATSW